MGAIIAFPANQERVFTGFLAGLRQACNREFNQYTIKQARHVAHRVLILVHPLADGRENIVNQRIHRVIATKLTDFGAQFCRTGVTQYGHHLFLEGEPVALRQHFLVFQQGFDFADRNAAFHQAFDLFNTQDIFIVKLTMTPFAALRLQQSITALPGTQRNGVDTASFGHFADTVIGH